MKNKLGIISGLILSLVIAGSAFAESGKAALKTTKSVASAKMNKSKPRKHRKARKTIKKVAKTTTPGS